MIPTISRNVIVLGIKSNGSREHAGLITRVLDPVDTRARPAAVNLVVFPDCAEPQIRSTVMLYETREEAEAALQPGWLTAFWPPRVTVDADPPAAAAALARAA